MNLRNIKASLGSLILVFGFVLISCGHPMDQTTINNGKPQSGSTTISDQLGTPNPNSSDDSGSFVAKPVRSTFENDCNAKRDVKIIKKRRWF